MILLSILGYAIACIVLYLVGVFVLSYVVVGRERKKRPGASRKEIEFNTRHTIMTNDALFFYMVPILLIVERLKR